MGHPRQKCYALDRMECFHFLYKILILIAFFRQKCPTAPPRQISGNASELGASNIFREECFGE